MQTVIVEPKGMFFSWCAEHGQLDVVCEKIPEPAQQISKKWNCTK